MIIGLNYIKLSKVVETLFVKEVFRSNVNLNMKKKKLLLIIPPQEGLLKGFATGIVSLAEYLEEYFPPEELSIKILDFSLYSYDEVKIHSIEYSSYTNLIVGITTTTASYQASLYTAQQFKRSNAQCTIVFGGHHASADPNTILLNHSDLVDYIIKGEGEKALSEFVECFPNVFECSNLVYLKNGKPKTNMSTALLETDDLDKISLSYKETELYGLSGKFDTVTYVSARGCPLRCSFCAVANQKMRSKSVEKVKQDLEKLLALGYNRIAIEDNFFAHSPKRTLLLCKQLQELKTNYPAFEWDCQTRVESLKNIELIKAMDEAGCYAVYIGVEALNTYDLEYLGKAKNGKKYMHVMMDSVLPNVFTTNVQCFINIQLGLPNNHAFKESKNNLKKIGKFAIFNKKEVTVFPMLHVVYPGTKHFTDGIFENSWRPDVFEHFTKWENTQKNLYNWLGENFAHGTGGLPIGILDKEKLKVNQFHLDHESIFEVQKDLKDIKNLPGIKVFEYESFLT